MIIVNPTETDYDITEDCSYMLCNSRHLMTLRLLLPQQSATKLQTLIVESAKWCHSYFQQSLNIGIFSKNHLMHIINYCRPVCIKTSYHLKMRSFPIWVLFVSLFFFIDHSTSSVDEGVRDTLIAFLNTLANTTTSGPLLGWSSRLDPCTDGWNHVACNRHNDSVTKLFLDGLNLNGTLDAASLCRDESLAKSLTTLDLDDNNIMGGIPPEIADCKQLTRFHVSGNQMSGALPASLSMLSNLKSLDLSNNQFSGELPNLARISGLILFFAQYNQFSGEIPEFDFSNLVRFNVSYNNFSGCIPNVNGPFTASSFLGNPELHGDPLSTKCPGKPKGPSRDQILMYSGYAFLGLLLLGLIIISLCKHKNKKVKVEAEKPPTASAIEESINMPSAVSGVHEMKTEEMSRTEYYSGGSADQSMVSSSLVVLTSPTVNGLKFEELLSAPAELLGRGKHGTLYKVSCENGMILAVKRIKDWAISSTDFKERMQRIDEVKHPNLLPPLAFYCSKQEKLLVYQYQQNGSLYSLLHGTQAFEWSTRLCAAARIADTLAFAHEELHEDGIAHGNLKSSNILLNKHMEPCISEYGLMVEDVVEGTEQESGGFRADICGLGVILLELLTGKVVQKSGMELAKWVHSVVREEWTAEVFDKALIVEGASEERMVNVLQVALKCVNSIAEARPGIKQVAAMINTIKEEEDRSSILSEA